MTEASSPLLLSLSPPPPLLSKEGEGQVTKEREGKENKIEANLFFVATFFKGFGGRIDGGGGRREKRSAPVISVL